MPNYVHAEVEWVRNVDVKKKKDEQGTGWLV